MSNLLAFVKRNDETKQVNAWATYEKTAKEARRFKNGANDEDSGSVDARTIQVFKRRSLMPDDLEGGFAPRYSSGMMSDTRGSSQMTFDSGKGSRGSVIFQDFVIQNDRNTYIILGYYYELGSQESSLVYYA